MDEAATGQADSTSDRSPHVRLRGIEKHFGGVQALRGIDLDVERGSIHGLVGENGAGKSTLGKIITGVHRPDGGVLEVDGREVHYGSPREALDDGLALIAQELSLVPKLSVMENVLLGSESRRGGLLRNKEMRERFRELDRLGLELPRDTPVGALRPADQQKVEVMRAVARDVDLIVMDEPTTSLTPDERDRLFEIVRVQAAGGTTIIFVSHALEGVLALCDTVTILRDGQLVRSGPAAEESPQSLVTAMIGRSLDAAFPDRTPPPPAAPVVLRAEGLCAGGFIDDVTFEVRAGEILGFSGLIGSGRSEVARALFGADSLDSGSVELDGEPVRLSSPRKAVKHGVVMLPESRKEQGLVLGASIADNVSLPHLERFNSAGSCAARARRARWRSCASAWASRAPRSPRRFRACRAETSRR